MALTASIFFISAGTWKSFSAYFCFFPLIFHRSEHIEAHSDDSKAFAVSTRQ